MNCVRVNDESNRISPTVTKADLKRWVSRDL